MYFTGTQAQRISETAQNIFMDYLRGKLNATPYSTTLGKAVFVVPSEEEAAAHYAGGSNGNPFVEVLLGEDNRTRWGKVVNGVHKPGSRHEMTFLLDMSMSDHAASQTAPAGGPAKDRLLVDAVRDIIETGYDALWALGLEEIEITAEPESQRAATKRNPHTVATAVYTLT